MPSDRAIWATPPDTKGIPKMTFYYAVKVEQLVPDSLLDSDDAAVAGQYFYQFEDADAPEISAEKLAEGYIATDRIQEHVLDLFHEDVGIHTLDHFSIEVVERAFDADIDRDLLPAP